MDPTFDLPFDNTFVRELEGFSLPTTAAAFPAPAVVKWNHQLADELGLTALADAPGLAGLLSGAHLPENIKPVAQAYAGHQFGGFSPRLGDGRAMLLGELVAPDGARYDLQLKGSGPTPFSRGGDGKAALGPVLREYLLGEAMHALSIPTTRALSAVTTGESIHRERALPGAVLARVAASHLRVGTFEFFASRDEVDKLQALTSYARARHYPNGPNENENENENENDAQALLRSVADAQASLIAQWMGVGFIHGVMNTDNVTVSGETIDYGPCAFMDAYAPGTVFSSIDRGGRYAYGNQPGIGKWNLARFAEALLPLLVPGDMKASVTVAEAALERFTLAYQSAWLGGMRDKLALHTPREGDQQVAEGLLSVLEAGAVDYTNAFRALGALARGDDAPASALFAHVDEFEGWSEAWLSRLAHEPAKPAALADAMDAVNPLYIPRNHLVEAALSAAVERNDQELFDALLDRVRAPYVAQPGAEAYAQPAPDDFGPYQTFCGT